MRKISVARALTHYRKVIVNFYLTRMEKFHSCISIVSSARAYSVKRSKTAKGRVGMQAAVKECCSRVARPLSHTLSARTSVRAQPLRQAAGKAAFITMRSTFRSVASCLETLEQKVKLATTASTVKYHALATLETWDTITLDEMDNLKLSEVEYIEIV